MKDEEVKGKEIAEKFMKKWLGKDHLYQIKEREFEERDVESKKEKRNKVISEKKNLYKPHRPEEIEEHEKWFYAKRAELDEAKQAAAQEKINKI